MYVQNLKQITLGLSKRVRPLTALLRKGAKNVFTPPTEVVVLQIFAELTVLPMLIFSDWDAVCTRWLP